MDTLITIKPFDLENKIIRKRTTNPGTIRKSQIDNEVAIKFKNFDKTKKGVISSDVIYNIKPELIITFPKYEEKINFATAIKRLAISNVLISEKYGRKDLKVTPKQLEKSLDELIDKEKINVKSEISSEEIKNLKQEIQNKDNLIKSQEEEIKELKRKEIVLKTVLDEYEDNEQLKNNIKVA